MEIKQHVSKLPTDYWRNQNGKWKFSRKKWQWKHNNSKTMECKKSISKREVCNNTILTQETRKASNRQPQLTPKTTDKEEQQKNSQN